MTLRWRRVVQGLLLGLTVLVVVDGGARPAAADVPEGCTYYGEEHQTSEEDPELVIYPGPAGFLRCRTELSSGDRDCFESEAKARQWGDGRRTGEDHPIFYCTESGHSWRRCMTDIRWGAGGDEETAFWDSSDIEGYVVVPTDLPESLNWWMNELVAENALAVDDQYAGGQGCAVASTWPELTTCEEINERKADLREEVEIAERLREHLNTPGVGGDSVIDTSNLDDLRAELHDLENVGGLIPDDCFGTYPSDRYQITWSNSEEEDGDGELASSNRLMGWLATIIFAIGKSAVVIMLWLVRLAFAFNINEYRVAVGDFASRIDRNIVHLGEADLSLFDMAWFALFTYAGFQALRGRAGRALGEICMAIVLAGLGVVLIGNFFPRGDDGNYNSSISGSNNAYEEESYFDSVGGILNASSLAMLRVANPETRDDGSEAPADLNISGDDMGRQEVEDLIRATNSRLHMEFIERPYYFINFGRDDFDEQPAENLPAIAVRPLSRDIDMEASYGRYTSGQYPIISCQEVITSIHSLPHTGSAWERRFMKRNGCDKIYEWNQEFNAERLAATALVTAVALVVSVCLALAAITLLILKFMVAVLFVALPIAVVMAILPGRSRSLGFGWATSLLQLWLAALGTSMILAMVLMGVDAVNATSEDRPLAERWMMILLVIMTLYILRKRIVSGAQSVANTLQDRLTASTGDTVNWGGGGGGRGRLNDMDLAGVDRGAARAGMAGKLAVIAGSAWAMRQGAAIGRRGMHMADAPRRMAVAEYGRRRSAALGQAWHWRNTMESQRVSQAQGMALDPKQSRDGAINDKFGGKTGANGGKSHKDQWGILEERRRHAAVAQEDYKVLAATKAGKPLTDEQRYAATRLGVNAGALSRAQNNPRRRDALLRQAGQNRDAAVAAAGGREAIGVDTKSARKMQADWNKRGDTTSYDARTQQADTRSGLTDVQRTDLLDHDKRLREGRVMTQAQGAAKLKEHNMG